MKPDNLFLDADVLVLGDVGSAEQLATIEAMQAPGSGQTLVDTLAPLFYRPPEVRQGAAGRVRRGGERFGLFFSKHSECCSGSHVLLMGLNGFLDRHPRLATLRAHQRSNRIELPVSRFSVGDTDRVYKKRIEN